MVSLMIEMSVFTGSLGRVWCCCCTYSLNISMILTLSSQQDEGLIALTISVQNVWILTGIWVMATKPWVALTIRSSGMGFIWTCWNGWGLWWLFEILVCGESLFLIRCLIGDYLLIVLLRPLFVSSQMIIAQEMCHFYQTPSVHLHSVLDGWKFGANLLT